MGDAVTQDNIDCEINKGNSTYGNRTNDRFRAHYTARFGHPPAGDPTFSSLARAFSAAGSAIVFVRENCANLVSSSVTCALKICDSR